MLICILTKNVITSCSVTMMLFLHLEVKPLMTLTTVLYLSCALISGHLAMMLMEAMLVLQTPVLVHEQVSRQLVRVERHGCERSIDSEQERAADDPVGSCG